MAKTSRLPFSPSGEFVARKPFIFGGYEIASGDDFPWQELDCEEPKLQRLYEAGYIAIKMVKPKEAKKEQTKGTQNKK